MPWRRCSTAKRWSGCGPPRRPSSSTRQCASWVSSFSPFSGGIDCWEAMGLFWFVLVGLLGPFSARFLQYKAIPRIGSPETTFFSSRCPSGPRRSRLLSWARSSPPGWPSERRRRARLLAGGSAGRRCRCHSDRPPLAIIRYRFFLDIFSGKGAHHGKGVRRSGPGTDGGDRNIDRPVEVREEFA